MVTCNVGRVRHRIDACVPTRVTCAVAGTYGTFWLLRGLRASAQEKAGPIREGVEDRGLGLGTIREQRGRGNVTETTDCEAYVASAWADIHRAWVKETFLTQ